MIGVQPHWYRGATAEYDAQAVTEIERMDYGIDGFSVNADSGATLGRLAVAKRLKHVKSDDFIIAHMNKPASDTVIGFVVAVDGPYFHANVGCSKCATRVCRPNMQTSRNWYNMAAVGAAIQLSPMGTRRTIWLLCSVESSKGESARISSDTGMR